MFKHLTDFGYVRTKGQAFGFYIAWLLVIALVGALASLLLLPVFNSAAQTFQNGFAFGERIGNFTGIVVTLGIAILVARGKGTLAEFSSIIVIIVCGIIAFFGGGLLGLIIPAYLTTRPHRSSAQR